MKREHIGSQRRTGFSAERGSVTRSALERSDALRLTEPRSESVAGSGISWAARPSLWAARYFCSRTPTKRAPEEFCPAPDATGRSSQVAPLADQRRARSGAPYLHRGRGGARPSARAVDLPTRTHSWSRCYFQLRAPLGEEFQQSAQVDPQPGWRACCAGRRGRGPLAGATWS